MLFKRVTADGPLISIKGPSKPKKEYKRVKNQKCRTSTKIKILKTLLAICPVFLQTGFAFDSSFKAWDYAKEIADENSLKTKVIDVIIELLKENLFSTDISFLSNENVLKLFNFTLKLAIALLSLLFTLIGLKTLLGNKFDWVQLSKKLFISSIISVGITTIIKYIILFNNALVSAIISNTVGEIQLQNLVTNTGGTLLTFAFSIIFIILAIRLLIYYFIRKFEILFLVCVTPIIWFLWVGGNQTILKTWWSELCSVIFIQPIHTIQLCLFSIITLITDCGTIERIGFAIGAFLLMLKTPNWLQKYIHSMPDVSGTIESAVDIATFGRERRLIGKFLNIMKGSK